MKLLQINTTVNSGSTGRIAEEIGLLAMQAGHQSFIAAANTSRPSHSLAIKIGTEWDRKLHGLKTRLFDRHGFGSANATKQFINEIREVNPDVIHLHNIHGYYLNIELLFNYLKEIQKPVIWTFHDCWPFTGHCSYFDAVNCLKWKTECNKCPNKKGYPASYLIDNSKKNYYDKNRVFNGLENLHIVTPSSWLADHVKNSFLKTYPLRVIHNGINLETFKKAEAVKIIEIKRKYSLSDKRILLGVASVWDHRKGLEDFIRLSNFISKKEQIVLVGLSTKQKKDLPTNITGIARTESMQDLVSLYSTAHIFVNPTYSDNFPTTNIEALACGTPVVTYNTGGSPEAIDENTGIVVEKGNIEELAGAIKNIVQKGKDYYRPLCRERAVRLFDKDDRFMDYLKLYDELLRNRKL